jgi:hypothetical protein
MAPHREEQCGQVFLRAFKNESCPLEIFERDQFVSSASAQRIATFTVWIRRRSV